MGLEYIGNPTRDWWYMIIMPIECTSDIMLAVELASCQTLQQQPCMQSVLCDVRLLCNLPYKTCTWDNPAVVADFFNWTTDDRRRAAGLSQQQQQLCYYMYFICCIVRAVCLRG